MASGHHFKSDNLIQSIWLETQFKLNLIPLTGGLIPKQSWSNRYRSSILLSFCGALKEIKLKDEYRFPN